MVKHMMAAAAGKTGKAKDTVEGTEAVTGHRLIRRGAQLALAEMATKFGALLFDTLPMLWECMIQPLLARYPIGGA